MYADISYSRAACNLTRSASCTMLKTTQAQLGLKAHRVAARCHRCVLAWRTLSPRETGKLSGVISDSLAHHHANNINGAERALLRTK